MTQATQAIDYTAIGNAAAEAEDQTKMKEGGGGFDPFPDWRPSGVPEGPVG